MRLIISLVFFTSGLAYAQHDAAEEWFSENQIRKSIYEEYIQINRMLGDQYIHLWTSTASYRKTEEGKKSAMKTWRFLADEGDVHLGKWSASAKEILRIPNLTRSEAETILILVSGYKKQIAEIRSAAYDLSGKLNELTESRDTQK